MKKAVFCLGFLAGIFFMSGCVSNPAVDTDKKHVQVDEKKSMALQKKFNIKCWHDNYENTIELQFEDTNVLFPYIRNTFYIQVRFSSGDKKRTYFVEAPDSTKDNKYHLWFLLEKEQNLPFKNDKTAVRLPDFSFTTPITEFRYSCGFYSPKGKIRKHPIIYIDVETEEEDLYLTKLEKIKLDVELYVQENGFSNSSELVKYIKDNISEWEFLRPYSMIIKDVCYINDKLTYLLVDDLENQVPGYGKVFYLMLGEEPDLIVDGRILDDLYIIKVGSESYKRGFRYYECPIYDGSYGKPVSYENAEICAVMFCNKAKELGLSKVEVRKWYGNTIAEYY